MKKGISTAETNFRKISMGKTDPKSTTKSLYYPTGLYYWECPRTSMALFVFWASSFWILASMRILIQLFSTMQIRIQLPKFMRIHADPDPQPWFEPHSEQIWNCLSDPAKSFEAEFWRKNQSTSTVSRSTDFAETHNALNIEKSVFRTRIHINLAFLESDTRNWHEEIL